MLNLYTVKVGDRLRLKDGRVVEVIENMGDGQWVEVKVLEGAAEDGDELVHSQDIAGLVPSP